MLLTVRPMQGDDDNNSYLPSLYTEKEIANFAYAILNDVDKLLAENQELFINEQLNLDEAYSTSREQIRERYKDY